MAAKQEREQTRVVTLPETKPKPFATTYAGGRKDGKWRIFRVELHEDGGKVRSEVTPVLEHPERLVARERLTTLLLSREVLP